MRPVLLVDFGSTYTKLTAVDLGAPRVLAHAQTRTTADTDISVGLDDGLGLLEEKTGPLSYEARLACSSAAGGLNMVASGLVPSLTAKAAQLAAYHSGARGERAVDVIVTRRRWVQRAPGGKVGQVLVKQEERVVTVPGELPADLPGAGAVTGPDRPAPRR